MIAHDAPLPVAGLSILPFLWNVWISRKSPLVNVDDPWGWGRSLEWATTSPPPRFNFNKLPRIRSEAPAFDLNHPAEAVAAPINPVQEAIDETTQKEVEQ